MNDIYLKITGKPRADGGSRMAMKVSSLIVCVVLLILGTLTSIILYIPAIVIIMLSVIENTRARRSAKASELALDGLSVEDRGRLIDEGRKAVASSSCEFGILTNYGIVDEGFFSRWGDIGSITVKSRHYIPKVPFINAGAHMIPAMCIIKGSVSSDGRTYDFEHRISVRPERDMSDEVNRFIDFALHHNGRISVNNDYRFWH